MDNLQLKLKKFFQNFKQVAYKKHDLILRPEENPPVVFYLEKGFVRLYSISQNGQEITLNIYKPETYFSMLNTLTESANLYFFEALTEVVVYRAEKAQFLAFLQQNNDILFDLTQRIVTGLGATLWLNERLLFSNAREKVIAVIWQLCQRFGEENQGKFVIKFPLTHQLIASLAGLTRETTSLEIKKLEKEKIIRKNNKFFVVNNLSFAFLF